MHTVATRIYWGFEFLHRLEEYWNVAQLVEHLPYMEDVGSSPIVPTKIYENGKEYTII